MENFSSTSSAKWWERGGRDRGAKYVNRNGKLRQPNRRKASGRYSERKKKSGSTSENILHCLQRDRWNSTAGCCYLLVYRFFLSLLFYSRSIPHSGKLLGLELELRLCLRDCDDCDWDCDSSVEKSGRAGEKTCRSVSRFRTEKCIQFILFCCSPQIACGRDFSCFVFFSLVGGNRQGNKTVSMW